MAFDFERGAVAQARVQALGVVVVVQVLGQFQAGCFQVSKAGSTGQQLGFERAAAASGQGVIVGVAGSAQAGNGLGASEQRGKGVAGVLAGAVGVHEQARWGLADGHGPVKSG